MLSLTSADPFPGLNALYPCVGAALIVWPRRAPCLIARSLGVLPLRTVGRISYSLYLWHWPVLVLFRHYIGNASPSPTESAALVLVSFTLSAGSWMLVEQPFLRRARTVPPWRTIGVGLVAVALVGTAGVGIYRQAGFPERLPPEMRGLGSLDEMWDWPCREYVTLDDAPSMCGFGAPWAAAKVKVLLWGDSHAAQMAPYLEAATRTSRSRSSSIPNAVTAATS
jgi:hypothetical protein